MRFQLRICGLVAASLMADQRPLVVREQGRNSFSCAHFVSKPPSANISLPGVFNNLYEPENFLQKMEKSILFPRGLRIQSAKLVGKTRLFGASDYCKYATLISVVAV